jgi:hypothetical protein
LLLAAACGRWLLLPHRSKSENLEVLNWVTK